MLMYLESASVWIHGKVCVVHRAHETDPGSYHIKHLVWVTHPQALQQRGEEEEIEFWRQQCVFFPCCLLDYMVCSIVVVSLRIFFIKKKNHRKLDWCAAALSQNIFLLSFERKKKCNKSSWKKKLCFTLFVFCCKPSIFSFSLLWSRGEKLSCIWIYIWGSFNVLKMGHGPKTH